MSELWKVIQGHLDKYGVREAEFARRMGSTPQTLNSWKNRGLKQLPDRRLLEAVADLTRTPYFRVLDLALFDIGYRDSTRDSAETLAHRCLQLPRPDQEELVAVLAERSAAMPDGENDLPSVHVVTNDTFEENPPEKASGRRGVGARLLAEQARPQNRPAVRARQEETSRG